MKMELSKALKKRYIERQDARRKFNAAKKQNLPIKATQVPSEEPKLQTYFGMSAYTCTKQHRLELFWSILGDCIDGTIRNQGLVGLCQNCVMKPEK